MVPPVVAEGLRARMSYREAAGWLRCTHVGIHPWDLALRDGSGVTGSYAAAAFSDRLRRELSTSVAQEGRFEVPLSDITINNALRLARLWRCIAELRTWRPLADAGALRETLRSLGSLPPGNPAIDDWLNSIRQLEHGPILIRAGRAAREWLNRADVEPHNPAGLFVAACLWREKTAHAAIPLPFWSAPKRCHSRLGLCIGLDWMAYFLECVAAASAIGLRELARLLEAEKKRAMLGSTARSRLPDALDTVLRAPIVTAESLAKALHVTPRTALALLQHLTTAGIVQQATRRPSRPAFTLA
jgi:HTH DNA binding domain